MFFVNRDIIERIIQDLLWDARDIEGACCRVEDYSTYILQGDDDEDGPRDGKDRYLVEIENTSEFFLVVEYLRAGLSFREVARISSLRESTIARYARIACAVNLQKVYELLQEAWTFSVVLDVSTHGSTSSLDIRVRLHLNRHGIISVHLLAIPLVEEHSGAPIFGITAKVLDVVSPSWRQTIIGITWEGEKKLIGRFDDIQERFKDAAHNVFIGNWNAAYEVGSVVQSAFNKMSLGRERFYDKMGPGRERFYRWLRIYIHYFRREQNLVAGMQSKAPKLADTCWESVYDVSRWFRQHKIRIDEHFGRQNSDFAPSPEWWINMLVIAEFSSAVSENYKKLQGYRQSAVVNALEQLRDLQTDLLRSVGGRGPLSESEASTLDNSEWAFSECRRFAASFSEAKQLVMNLGPFATGKIAILDASAVDTIVHDVANLYISAAAGVAAIHAEREVTRWDYYSMRTACQFSLPPVLFHQVARLPLSRFQRIIYPPAVWGKLLACGWDVGPEEIEREHRELVVAAFEEPELRAAVGACTDDMSFDDGWSFVKGKGRFELLQSFLGGFATVFSGTVQLERDFSILKAEHTELRTAIADLWLEGALHSKQFSTLASL